MFIPVWTMQSQGAISVYENAKCSYQFGQCSHRELSVFMRMLNVHTSLDNAVTGSYQCMGMPNVHNSLDNAVMGSYQCI